MQGVKDRRILIGCYKWTSIDYTDKRFENFIYKFELGLV